jgi:hypothetical protein
MPEKERGRRRKRAGEVWVDFTSLFSARTGNSVGFYVVGRGLGPGSDVPRLGSDDS